MSIDQRPEENVEQSGLIQLRGRARRKEQGPYLQKLLDSSIPNTLFTHLSGNFIYQEVGKIASPTQAQVLINQNKLSGRGEGTRNLKKVIAYPWGFVAKQNTYKKYSPPPQKNF